MQAEPPDCRDRCAYIFQALFFRRDHNRRLCEEFSVSAFLRYKKCIFLDFLNPRLIWQPPPFTAASALD